MVWGSRPKTLQNLINVAGSLFLAHDVPVMAKYVAGKIFHTLMKPSSLYSAGGNILPPAEHLAETLVEASRRGGTIGAMGDAILAIAPELRWYRSKSGPFASVNFARDHAHASIIGPGGIEDRDDVYVGLTVMGPYSRFPDHRRKYATAYLPLSRVEVLTDDGDWTVADPGRAFFVEEGREFAMRCTGNPLLLLWCQRTGSEA
ncbi:putative transcriptional regulator protein [Sinorhizobium sojae CCBAU 05684]|uniref:Putative transcriptional regulator protein n=2 Tax=Sinorhizobium sojae TaxID=716925 RepID=A0A249PB16_9HYPH|nr:dimethylsulfonioproprionate lyase family protein [Sinorhizobium sojae]ASY63026.1 putative transcriptional regulator protein [Sinorhizobium sojae CCBAU 05684]